MTNQVICAYCAKEKEDNTFVIGASIEPDWVMVEGTGKMTCPNCYNVAVEEGQQAIKRATFKTEIAELLKKHEETTNLQILENWLKIAIKEKFNSNDIEWLKNQIIKEKESEVKNGQ